MVKGLANIKEVEGRDQSVVFECVWYMHIVCPPQ